MDMIDMISSQKDLANFIKLNMISNLMVCQFNRVLSSLDMRIKIM